jgi:hypothetical protein
MSNIRATNSDKNKFINLVYYSCKRLDLVIESNQEGNILIKHPF